MAVDPFIARGFGNATAGGPDIRNMLRQWQQAQQENELRRYVADTGFAYRGQENALDAQRYGLDREQFTWQQAETKAAQERAAQAAAVPFEQTREGQEIAARAAAEQQLIERRAAQERALIAYRNQVEKSKGGNGNWAIEEMANSDGTIQRVWVDRNDPTKKPVPFGAATQSPAGTARSGQQMAVEQTYKVYKTARDGIAAALMKTDTGPIVGRMPAFTANQQVAVGSIAAMAPILKQLFRSAGEGVFTDKDQELLMNMIPTRTMRPEAQAQQLELIDRIVRAKLGMEDPATGNGASAEGQPYMHPSGAKVTIIK
jgi:hypothetical protein